MDQNVLTFHLLHYPSGYLRFLFLSKAHKIRKLDFDYKLFVNPLCQ